MKNFRMTRTGSARVLATAMALVALAATGCAGGQTADPTGPPANGTAPESQPGIVSVQAEGDGPIALTTDASPEEPATQSGQFIVGPGGCFALVDDSQPRLIIFPVGTEFVLTGGQPSATPPDGDQLSVGDGVSLEASEVDLAATDGIPAPCTQGAADSALVVHG